MKSIPKHKYPSWFVRKRLNHLYNKYYLTLKSREISSSRNNPYTWADSYHKAQGKLYYRFIAWKNTKYGSKDEWMALLSHIKARYVQLFDSTQEWRIIEYLILEKMNSQVFHRLEAPNILWHYVAVNAAGRANKMRHRSSNLNRRTARYNWADVIASSLRRIWHHKINTSTIIDNAWELCFKANWEKIRARLRWLDWNSCIQRNYNKAIRIFNNSIPKEKYHE
jgi:hypothetical protein